MCKFKETYTSKKTDGQTEGWMKDGQNDEQKDKLKDRQTLTNADKLSDHGRGSNKTFAYICQCINHYISQSFFIKTLSKLQWTTSKSQNGWMSV